MIYPMSYYGFRRGRRTDRRVVTGPPHPQQKMQRLQQISPLAGVSYEAVDGR